MTDEIADTVERRWKGLKQSMIAAIHKNVQRRFSVSYIAQGNEGEPPEVPIGLTEVIAEETIKHVPALLLWNWEDDVDIMTPEKIRRGRRGR